MMTIDEAIKHCKEIACGNNACALEHKQLEKWLTELKELKEHKPDWSEEDEKEVAVLEAYIRSRDWSERHIDRALNIVDELVKKLKSLTPKNRWKPSEEQMDALEFFVRSIGESGYASPYDNNTKLLYSLLSDLKNLRDG